MGEEKVVVVGGAESGPDAEMVTLLSLLGLALAGRGLQSSEEVEAVSEGRVVAGREGAATVGIGEPEESVFLVDWTEGDSG